MTHQLSISSSDNLPLLVDRASAALVSARSAAEVLEAKELAGAAYDKARRLGRLARAKAAHDDLIAAVLRSQADAAEIEAGAKRRLADEYTSAQARGEIVGPNGGGTVSGRNGATAAELRIPRKLVHEGRLIRDAEENDPGVVRRSLDDMVAAGEEPTKAALARAVAGAAGRASNLTPKPKAQPGEAWTRFVALADALEGFTAAEIIAAAGVERSKLGQRASGIAALMDEILEGLE